MRGLAQQRAARETREELREASKASIEASGPGVGKYFPDADTHRLGNAARGGWLGYGWASEHRAGTGSTAGLVAAAAQVRGHVEPHMRVVFG